MEFPYAFAENRPVDGDDLSGRESENFMSKFKNPGELAMKLSNKNTAQIQMYSTTISKTKLSYEKLKASFKSAPQNIHTNSKATFNAPVDGDGKPSQFKVGSYIKIDIQGPLNNSYVKVAAIDDEKGILSATFITMQGHVEKGVIKFSLIDKGNKGYEFKIVRMSDVDQGAAKLIESYARSQQKKSWEEVLNNIDKKSGEWKLKEQKML